MTKLKSDIVIIAVLLTADLKESTEFNTKVTNYEIEIFWLYNVTKWCLHSLRKLFKASIYSCQSGAAKSIKTLFKKYSGSCNGPN